MSRQATKTKGIAMENEGTKIALLVDPKTAARLLSVSQRKLFSMTHEDEPGLPYVRCGRLIRYPVADLQRWIETHTEGGSRDAS